MCFDNGVTAQVSHVRIISLYYQSFYGRKPLHRTVESNAIKCKKFAKIQRN